MKKIIAILSLVLFLGIPTLFGQWELVNPYPTAEDLRSVVFLNHTAGWAVGNRGAVLKTTDGGQHWQLIQYLTLENLHDIEFIDGQHGFIAGENGTLFRTDDGGLSWMKTDPGTAEDLRDIDFSDAVHGWIVGTGGTILRTTDGGANWQPQTGAPAVPLFSVAAVTTDHGWIGGNYAALRTLDGGQNWTNHQPLYGFFEIYNDFYFCDDRHGWALADIGDLLVTNDGGNTWDYPHTIKGNSMFFIDSLQGWIVSDHGKVWHTADGGLSLTLQETPTDADLYSVYFYDAENGWAVGETGQIIHTSDGGQTWSAQSYGLVDFLISACFTDHDNGWIAGYSGPILHTSDGGETWETQNTGSGDLVRDIYFSDPDHGWALGQWSSVSRTTNGGETWITDSLAGPFHYFVSIAFTDTLHGWFTASYMPKGKQDKSAVGILYSTEDGGITWDSTELGDTYPRDIFFIDKDKGWITCSGEQILVTVDGGMTWDMHDCGINLIKLCFVNASTGYGLVNDQVPTTSHIFTTTDGGLNWTMAHSRPDTWLNGLDFPDEQHGWAAGTDNLDDRSIILRTTDGGLTWEEQAFPTHGLWDVVFTDTNNGWAVGEGGSIYHTSNGGLLDIPVPPFDPHAEFLKIYPNPAAGTVWIEYFNDVGTGADIRILDLAGQTVWRHAVSDESPGSHTLVWKPQAGAGMYLIVCRLGNRLSVKKVLLAE